MKNVFVLDRDRLIASRIIIPGDPGSLLLKMVESNAMPPEGPALSDEEKKILRDWVMAGAPQLNDKTGSATRAFIDEQTLIGSNSESPAREQVDAWVRLQDTDPERELQVIEVAGQVEPLHQ